MNPRNNRLALLLVLMVLTFAANVMGQIACPPNIGFENGNFANWEFANGVIQKLDGAIILNPASPDQYRQRLLDKNIGGTDPYGEFPVISPNASRYALKLGNDNVRGEAEQASYTFTIPATQDQYTLIYYYAVVFQDPGHFRHQQPRFTSKVFNVTEDEYIECGSYEFIASSGLPGFELAKFGREVYFKSWSPVSLNLSGYAGKTIRLEFTNNDCSEGGHFGYAYLDMNENCAEPVTGNVSCVSATDLTLQAPPGFMEYQWFNGDFSAQLGSSSSLQISPVPPANTDFAMRLVPYPGLGCIDTVTTTIRYSGTQLNLEIPAEIDGCIVPGIDLTSPRLKTGSSPGLTFTYFADNTLSTFLPAPQRITESGEYFVQAMNAEGCTVAKAVSVVIHPDPSFIVTDPPAVQYPATVSLRSAVQVSGYTYSYWKDAGLTTVMPKPDSVNLRGTYYVKAMSEFGCTTVKPVNVTIIPSPEALITAPNAFTPNNDGLNDVFRIIVNDRVKMHQLRIYNRWGQLIFSTTDLTQGWHADKMPSGTYIWVVDGEDLFNKNKLKKSGQLLLLR